MSLVNLSHKLRVYDFCCFDCLLTVFDGWYTVPIVKNTQNHWCTNRHRSTRTVPTVYQRCTNSQKQSKDSQNSKNNHWCTNRHRSTKTVPTVYQSSKTVQTQSKQHKNDHWCTSHHMSTKTVPSVLNKFFSELQYSAVFGRESRKFAGAV